MLLDGFLKGDRYMEKYTKRVEELNDNDAFTSWITAEEDERLILNTEKRISYNEGMERGMEQGMEIVVKNMLEENMDTSIISKITGFTKEQIERLK